MSHILAERGLLDDSQGQTSGVTAETFHGEKSTNFHGEQSVGPAPPLEGQYLPAKEGVTLLDTDMLDPSPYQARKIFNEVALQLLADAIQANGGLNNPIVVRPKANGRFELDGGERRWPAHDILQWTKIEAYVRDLSDEDAAVLAVTDNDSQEALTDYERALSYEKLLDSKAVMNQMTLSRRVGRSMGTISRCLAYFKLAQETLTLLEVDPAFIRTKHVADLAAMADEGQKDLDVQATQLVFDGKLSQVAAVAWIRSSVTKSSDWPPAPPVAVKLCAKGRESADLMVRGQKITLDWPKGVNPQEVLELIKKHFEPPSEA
ncbi:ParB/RepB/Spo0J family partition protein [Pseudomonas aeruginosa]|uniref:ParB/RepB/Spo0J family partition protein n=1 Tax=Pseudomonas aeruginosa TaxID=287 RepID=UPI001E5C3E77|nr:ParB/RepB/Spo0J family partition protein [Pseudomonas aeruginosa]MCC9290074.1 ParB/RepB/Spo0J family partition protein [Pseudomonas aeruginosa]UVN19075.1 parB-like partition protein [Pseudomonas aeruginosa]